MADRLHVQVTTAPIDVAACIAATAAASAGAQLVFVGTVRDHKHGRRVLRVDYEAYVPMAERILGGIGAEMLSGWPACHVALVHRVGRLEVGEASIVIAVSTPGRADGFAALRHGIEAVKRDLPVWKKEHFEDGEVWVQEGS